MPSSPDLWWYFVLVAGVVALPGMDMAYVIASALTAGLRGGALAVAGIALGGLIHVLVGATGIAALLVVFPEAFNAVLIAGAAYMAWIGISLLRARSDAPSAAASAPSTSWTIFRRALLTCLLNPKAYAFVLAVLPPFLRSDARPLAAQALLLAAITVATQIAVYGAIALGVAQSRRWFGTRPRASLYLARTVGVLLIAAAALTTATAWRPVTPANAATVSDLCCDVVELRQYTLKPGRRDELIALFDRHFVESQEATGMRVIGQFRDLNDPNRFVWLRGFPDMEARRQALEAFYGGPVWAAHRDAANATMIDVSDVLLLKPASPVSGIDLRAGVRPSADTTETDEGGLVLATIYRLAEPADAAFLDLYATAIAPAHRRAGAQVRGRFVTEASANTFPRLPVREGEHVFVWLASFADASALTAYRAALAADPRWRETEATLQRRLIAPELVIELAPTPRSLLRHHVRS